MTLPLKAKVPPGLADNITMVEVPLVEEADFNPVDHPRDRRGRFRRTLGGSAVRTAAKKFYPGGWFEAGVIANQERALEWARRRASEVVTKHGGNSNISSVISDPLVPDMAGKYYHSSHRISLGRSIFPALEAVDKFKREGRPLPKKIAREAWLANEVLQHEINHSILGGDLRERGYSVPGGRTLEEGLAEEVSRMLNIEWLRDRGETEALAWLKHHTKANTQAREGDFDELIANGTYQEYRSRIRRLFEAVGIPKDQWHDTVFKLKFDIPRSEDRIAWLAQKMKEKASTEDMPESSESPVDQVRENRKWERRVVDILDAPDSGKPRNAVTGFKPIIDVRVMLREVPEASWATEFKGGDGAMFSAGDEVEYARTGGITHVGQVDEIFPRGNRVRIIGDDGEITDVPTGQIRTVPAVGRDGQLIRVGDTIEERINLSEEGGKVGSIVRPSGSHEYLGVTAPDKDGGTRTYYFDAENVRRIGDPEHWLDPQGYEIKVGSDVQVWGVKATVIRLGGGQVEVEFAKGSGYEAEPVAVDPTDIMVVT